MSEFRKRVWAAVGAAAKEARQERGLTQEEVADALLPFWPKGSQSALAKMERGERLISTEHLLGLCWVLQVAPRDLLPTIVDQRGDRDVEALVAEREALTKERQAWEQRWMKVQSHLDALEPSPSGRVIALPSAGS